MPPNFTAGSASVNVVPDFTNAQRKIKEWFAGMRDVQMNVSPEIPQAQLAAMRAQVNSGPRPSLKVDIDYKHFGAKVAKLTDFFVGFSAIDDIFVKAFGPKSVLMVNGVGALTAIAGSAAQAGGALALLPALAAGAAVPIATLTIGLQGMGDAFKALASGDAEKINEAMKNLAPAARNFAREVHSLAPAFKDLRLDIQQELFRGLGDRVHTLGTRMLPVLHQGLVPIAGDLRELASNIIYTLGQAKNLDSFKVTLDNLHLSTANFAESFAPLTQMFIDFATVGSQFLPDLARGFTSATDAAAAWVAKARETGQLQEIIQRALDTIKQLAAIVWDLGYAISGVLRAGAETGGTLLDIISQLVAKIAVFLNSASGQSALHTFFTNIGTAVQAIMPGIAALVEALVTGVLPALSGLASAVAPVVASLLEQLAQAVKEIAPLFYPAMANAISAILSALAPLVPVISHVAQIIFPILADVMSRMAPFISAIAEAFGELAMMVADALAPILPVLADALVRILDALMPIIPPILQLVQALLPPFVELLGAIIPVVVQVVEAIAPAVAMLVESLTPALKLVAQIVTWAFKEVIGPIITFVVNTIIVPLINIISMAFQGWGMLIEAVTNNVIKPAWAAIQAAAEYLWNTILKPIWDQMKIGWELLMTGIKIVWENVMKPAWDAIATAAHWLWETVIRPIWDAMKAGWDLLMNGIAIVYNNVLVPVWEAIKTAIDAVKRAFEVVVEAIKAAWDRMMIIAATPINFVIEIVFNRGLFAAWNWVVDKLSLPFPHAHFDQIGPPESRFAEGGPVPGYSPSKKADNIPIMATAGEYMHPVDAVEFYGLGAMEAIRARKASIFYADGGLIPHFATGGQLFDTVHKAFPNTRFTSGYRPGDPGYHGKNMAADIGGPVPAPSGSDLLASIEAWIAANYGRSTTELIYDGIGNRQADLWHGAPHTYNASTQADHHNHVHWAMIDAIGNAIGGASASASAAIDKPWYEDLWGSVTGAFNWFKEKIAAVGQLVTKFGQNDFVQMVASIPGSVLSKLWSWLEGKIAELFLQGRDRAPGDTAGIKQDVQFMARSRGWDVPPQWDAIDWIVTKESSWNPTAQNPTSTASGLFQMIDSTWRAYRPVSASGVAHAKEARVNDQAQAGLLYIEDVYQRPTNAKQYHINHGSYDSGGWLPPGISTIFNGTGRPEPVLTAAEHDSLMAWQGHHRHSHRDRDDDRWLRDVHFHGVEERTRTRVMDDLWHRMRVERRGGVHSSTSVYSVG